MTRRIYQGSERKSKRLKSKRVFLSQFSLRQKNCLSETSRIKWTPQLYKSELGCIKLNTDRVSLQVHEWLELEQ